MEENKEKKIDFKKLLILGIIGAILSVEGAGIIFQYAFPKAQDENTWIIETQTININPVYNLNIVLNNELGKLLFFAVFVVYAFIAYTIITRLSKAGTTEDDPRGFKIFRTGTYGTSGWMSKKEMLKNFEVCPADKTDGIILGKDIESDNAIALGVKAPVNKHIAVYGASGTGKSRRFVRNMIIQCVKRNESLIMTDPKGELYNDTAGYLMKKGYNVKVLDLVDTSFSDSWNVLSVVTNAKGDDKVLAAQTLADVILRNTAKDGGGGDAFWDNAELNLIKGLALLVAMDKTLKHEEKTLGRLYEILAGDPKEMAAMFDNLKGVRMPNGEPHPALACWNIFMQASEQVRGNIIIGLAVRIQVFQAPGIRKMTSYDVYLSEKEQALLEEYNDGALKSDYGHLSFPKILEVKIKDPDGGEDLLVEDLVTEMRSVKVVNRETGEGFKVPKILKIYNKIEKDGSGYPEFDSALVKYIMKHEGCIDLVEPAKTPCAYYLIMSDQQSTLNFISSLFFTFLFIDLVKYADVYGTGGGKIDPVTGKRKRTGACDVPVNFILDEFPNIGQIPDFTKKLSTIRSRDLRVDVIFQNIAQLQNRYENGLWEEIIGNCDTQLFLGCTDITTAKFVSERTGTMTIRTESTSTQVREGQIVSPSSHGESNAQGKREVLTPDEVLRLEGKYALIILRSQKVLKCRKFDYSEHPEATALDSDKVDINEHISVSGLLELQNLKDDEESAKEMQGEEPININKPQSDIPIAARAKEEKKDDTPQKNEESIPIQKPEKQEEFNEAPMQDIDIAKEKISKYKEHCKSEREKSMAGARKGKDRRIQRLKETDTIFQKILVSTDE